MKLFRYILLLPVFFIILHLTIITVFDPYNYKPVIEKRQKKTKEIDYYRRGDIYDRYGRMLVTTQYRYQLDLDKNLIITETEPEDQKKIFTIISETVSKVTGSSVEALNSRVLNDKYSSIFLSDNLLFTDIKTIKDIISEEVASDTTIHISRSRLSQAFRNSRISAERIYPFGNLAPRLLGMAITPKFIDKSPDESHSLRPFIHLKGACGMEATFDKHLKGKDGWRESIYDATGREIFKPSLRTRRAVNGEDVYLTINIRYQEILEEQLSEGLEKYGAKSAMGVIMDIHTGGILALSGQMETDADFEISELRSFSNLPVSYSIEPGSTMKPITALLAMEKEIYEDDELINCHTLEMEYADGTRKISDHKEFTEMNLENIIVHSSNPGISRVAMEVGKTDLYNRLIQIGLGRETLSGIYGESKGIFRPVNKWSQYSLCSIAFGQEIAINMLHLAVLYAAIANEGKIIQPKILLYSTDDNSNINNILEAQVFRSISNHESLAKMQVYLKNVVETGTGTNTKLEYIDIAGKTGTAEVIKRDEKGKTKTHHNSVFAGYFPVEDPQLVMVIAYERCKEDKYLYYYASQSAVPTFKNVVQQILILPENNLVTNNRIESHEKAILPNLVGLTKQEAVKILDDMKMEYSFVNKKKKGIISDQFPPANIQFARNQVVKLAIAEEATAQYNDSVVPDFKGLTAKYACLRAEEYGLEVEINGIGTVYKQSPSAGTKIEARRKCQLYLK